MLPILIHIFKIVIYLIYLYIGIFFLNSSFKFFLFFIKLLFTQWSNKFLDKKDDFLKFRMSDFFIHRQGLVQKYHGWCQTFYAWKYYLKFNKIHYTSDFAITYIRLTQNVMLMWPFVTSRSFLPLLCSSQLFMVVVALCHLFWPLFIFQMMPCR